MHQLIIPKRSTQHQTGCYQEHQVNVASRTSLTCASSLDLTSMPPHHLPRRSAQNASLSSLKWPSNDFYLVDAQNRKRSKYVELVRALREYGWNVITEQGLHFNEWYLQYTYAKNDTTDKIDAQGVITHAKTSHRHHSRD